MIFYHQSIHAQVYKCKNSAGKITYSESTCPKNMSGGEIIIEPNVIDSTYIRGKIESQKIQKTNSSVITVTTETFNNSTAHYMSDYDLDIRLKQLKVQMSDQSAFSEKISDAKNEYAQLESGHPKSLSHDLKQKRKNLKVDLTHPEQTKRQAALSGLTTIYFNY